MNAVLAIAARELRSQFLSPSGWLILAVNAAVLGYVFLVQLERFAGLQTQLGGTPGAPGATELVALPLIKTAGFVFLLTTPLLTMNLLAEERRQGTLVLLLASPVSSSQIVLGKYLGVTFFLACLWLLTALLPATLLLAGTLDYGLLASALLGLGLLLAAMGATGLLVSCHAALPSIAAFGTFGLLLLLWVLSWGTGGGVLTFLSLSAHFERSLTGVVRLEDICYFGLLIGGCLGHAVWRLRDETSLS